MPKDSKSFFQRLTLFTRSFGKRKLLSTLDKHVDLMIRRNEIVSCELQVQIKELNWTAQNVSSIAPSYRWERLVRDLNELTAGLNTLRDRLHNGKVRDALNMFNRDLWPLTLKICCRYENETGLQKEWIKDTSELYVLCEKFAEQSSARSADDVGRSDVVIVTRNGCAMRIAEKLSDNCGDECRDCDCADDADVVDAFSVKKKAS